MSEVEITTDGSCLGKPGPGGWACILRCGQHERVLQGGVAETTNNRMELITAIEGLRVLKRASQVTVLTDSEYVRRGITEFIPRWKANGWRASTGEPVVNRDLWEELEELVGHHEVTWIHVRGHSGNRTTNGVTRWRSRLRVRQSKALLALDGDSAEKALCQYFRVSENQFVIWHISAPGVIASMCQIRAISRFID
jgi:ribonuclease HI